MATFWNTLNKVRVRFVGEITNSEVLQNMAYTLVLKTGNASPQTVYQSGQILPHFFASRWTKSYWIGGAPPAAVDIDYNAEYVMATRFLPTYNLTLANVTEDERTSQWNAWQNAQKDLFEAGSWVKYGWRNGALTRHSSKSFSCYFQGHANNRRS